jgi:hypothetical protein
MEEKLFGIINELQKPKMKEIWENKEDDFWDNFIEKLN